MTEEEATNTAALVNEAERELAMRGVRAGHLIGVYKSPSEYWNGVMISKSGISHDSAKYGPVFDDDAGWSVELVSDHIFFPIGTGTHDEAFQVAMEHIDLHNKGEK